MYRYFCGKCRRITEMELLEQHQERRGCAVVWVRKLRCIRCGLEHINMIPLKVMSDVEA